MRARRVRSCASANADQSGTESSGEAGAGAGGNAMAQYGSADCACGAKGKSDADRFLDIRMRELPSQSSLLREVAERLFSERVYDYWNSYTRAAGRVQGRCSSAICSAAWNYVSGFAR